MKQVIVVNQALRLPVGKLAAQVAHAAVGAFLSANAEAQVGWLQVGMPKIVVSAANQDELMRLRDAAEKSGIPTFLVQDAGRTVLQPGTVTCVGFGPAPINEVDAITGELRLV